MTEAKSVDTKKKESTARSVIELPLKVEKWQSDVINKRFECIRKVYNNMLHDRLKLLNKMESDPEYQKSLKTIKDSYKIKDDKRRRKFRGSEEYKNAVAYTAEKRKEYGFTQFSFRSLAIMYSKVYKENIGTTSASISIGDPMWAAFEKYFFGNGETVHFKKFDSVTTVASDGKSGIRILDKDNQTVLHRQAGQKLWLSYGLQGHRVLKMPIVIDEKNDYLKEMLERKIRIVRLKKKNVRGTDKFYVQLTVEGEPAKKYDKDGNEKNVIGSGRLGIYIDTTSVTIYDGKNFTEIDLSKEIDDKQEQIAEIQRYMSASSIATNPENFLPDGTIRPGKIVDGRRLPLKWNRSNGYKKARKQKANLNRVVAEQRKISRYELANRILARGDEIVINDYPFQYAAMRKEFEEGEEKTESGQNKSKKKAGKTIGYNAPATLVALMQQKLSAHPNGKIQKIALTLTKEDYQAEGYRKVLAKQMYEMN